MLVGERMSQPVITVNPETTLEAAFNLMRKERIGRLPVVNKQGELVGIITEGAVLKAMPSDATTLSVWEQREIVRMLTVNRIMATDVITIDEDAPIEEAARIMADNEISGLPVTCEGRMVGFITETDLFKIFLELFGARDAGVRLSVVLPHGPGELLKISKAVYDLGGDIIALGTIYGDNSSNGEIIMKVAGVSKQALVDAITPIVLKIKDVRE